MRHARPADPTRYLIVRSSHCSSARTRFMLEYEEHAIVGRRQDTAPQGRDTNMFNGTALLADNSTWPVPVRTMQDYNYDTANQALESRVNTSCCSPDELSSQTSQYPPLPPNLAMAPRLAHEEAEPDGAIILQAFDHGNAESDWENSKRRSPSDLGLLEGSARRNIAQTPPLEMAEPGPGTKRRKTLGSRYQAEGLSGPSKAGPLGWAVSTSEGSGAVGLLPRYDDPTHASYTKSLNDSLNHMSRIPLAEPSCYINNTDGAYTSRETAASSTHGDEDAIIDLISSNDSFPHIYRSTATPATNESTPQKLKLKLKFKRPLQAQLHQPHFASSLDSQGSPYPSPYASTESSNNILAYDAAKAKKGTTLQPTAQAGKEDKYTSVLEHDLTITKTRLAKANGRLMRMEAMEKENEVLRTENQDLEKRLAELVTGQESEGRAGGSAINYCAIAEQAAVDAMSSYLGRA